MSGWALFKFWTYIVAVAILLLNTLILCIRSLRSQGRDRRLFLIAALLTAFTAVLIMVIYFTTSYR